MRSSYLLDKDEILAENKKDLEKGKENGLSDSVLDRIMLNEQRIIDMSDAIGQLIELKDPVGETIRVDQEGKWFNN